MAIPLLALAGYAIGALGFAQSLPPLHRTVAYNLNKLIPNEIVGVQDALELAVRKIWSEDDLIQELKQYGLNENRIRNMLKIKEQLIGVSENISLYRRQAVDEKFFYDENERLGLTKARSALLLKATEYIPNVQDIIRFAVREVYSPEIASTFGQFEGAGEVSEAAKDDLNAIGMLPEVLQKYWAAHWELPSAQMGFEMLHRGVISENELDLLLRALDVMPFWRPKIKAISFNPLTRVDVRRMHKLGVLTDDDLLKAYKDIGYNDENAQRLADFTILYNTDPESAEQTEDDKAKAKEKDLTKSDILNGYTDGLFDETESREMLSSLGYSTDEIDYYLSREDFKAQQDEINLYLKYYKSAYVSNIMTANDVINKLNALNLTGKRIEILISQWELERQSKTAKPTKAEILTFLRKKIIDESRARTELQGLGYDNEYINWYLESL